jgi:hypothetical protein
MVPAAAALLGAFGGSLIGLVGAVAIDRAQRGRSVTAERQRAFAGFLGSLYPVVAELRDMPPNRAGGLFDRIDSLLSTRQSSWARTRRGLAAVSPQLFPRIDRLLAMVATLQVIDLPKEVRCAVDEASEYVERLGEERSPDLVAAWPDIHERLQNAAALL